MPERFAGEGPLVIKHSLLAIARNMVGSNTFRNLYFRNRSYEIVDEIYDGDLACAVTVSSPLHFLDLIKNPQTFVDSLVEELKEQGWSDNKEPRAGSVVVWAPKLGKSGNVHRHIGFHLGNKEAISNDDEARSPQIHHETFGVKEDGSPVRPIVAAYWHPRLDD